MALRGLGKYVIGLLLTFLQFCSCRFYYYAPILSPNVSHEILYVGDLNKILNVFEKTHYLVTLTVLQDTIFPEFSYPVVLRKLQPVWLWNQWEREVKWRLDSASYVHLETLKRGMNVSKAFPTCFSFPSPYFAQYSLSCGNLNVSAYWKQSRPWNSEVSIILFPHTHLHEYLSFDDFTYMINRNKLRHTVLPSSLPPIKILVVHPSEASEMDQLTGTIALLANSLTLGNKYMSNGQFYIVNATYSHPTLTVGESEKHIVIQALNIIQLCRRDAEIYVNIVPENNWKTMGDVFEMTRIISPALCQGAPQMNKILINFDNSHDLQIEIISFIVYTLKYCQAEPLTYASKDYSQMRHLSAGYASAWVSILGNYSYDAPSFQICDEGKLVYAPYRSKLFDISNEIKASFVNVEQSATIFPAVVASTFNDLRFITCGYRGLEQLSFGELFIAFDATVWLVLGLFACLLSIILHNIPTLGSVNTFTQSAMIPVKMLLEQGNPFPDSLINNHRCKWIAATVLLMGIILSNAYKNTNVYNMMIPRKPVTYQHLEELIQDSVTIHTRSDRVRNTNLLDWLEKYDGNMTLSRARSRAHELFSGFRLESANYNLNLLIQYSEVYGLRNAASAFNWPYMIKNLTELLYHTSSLVPLNLTFLTNIAKRLRFSHGTNIEEKDFLNEFYPAELEHLIQFLRRCKQAALVLPTQLGFEIVERLGTEGHENVYQGTETYYEVNIAFVLRGFVPQFLTQRIKYAERCGLWKRWQNLFKKTFLRKNQRRSETLKIPTMTGNIIIIFLLLTAGLLVSVIGFCIELCPSDVPRAQILKFRIIFRVGFLDKSRSS